MKKHIQFLLPILFLFLGFQGIAQYDIPEKPSGIKQTSVYDYVNLLSKGEKSTLENKLIKYADTTSTQVVVAIINSTKGESIGILTPRWAHEWGIGEEKEDNGVFILLAKDDKKVWISPGYGVEHKLTAGITGEIVRNVIIPEFKKGDYFSGFNIGTDAVFNVLNGEFKGSRKENTSFDPTFLIILVFFIIFIILASKGNRNNRGGKGRGYRRSDSRDIFETIILTNSGRGGFGGGSFGSGSFGGSSSSGGFGGGFGGGGFSGGGAGGSW